MNHKNRKRAIIYMLLMLLLCLPAGCGRNANDEITSLEQLNAPEKKVAVASDTTDDKLVELMLPQVKIEYVKDMISAYTAVSQGKLDALVYDKRAMELAIENGQKGVRLLDETMGEGTRVAVGLSPVSKIPDLQGKINDFLDQIKEDGTLEDMQHRWLDAVDDTMPDIPVPEDPELTLTVGTFGAGMPYSFYKGTELVGRDVEMARRFAAYLNAELILRTYDYDGLLAAAKSGDVDCIMANLYITPERAEAIPFSEPFTIIEVGVMVRDQGHAHGSEPEYSRFSELEDKKIGVTTGSIQALQVQERFPEAEILYFNNDVDMLSALKADKIDAFASAEPLVRYMMTDNPELTFLDEQLGDGIKAGAIFPKTEEGQALCDEFSEYIKEIKSNGVYDDIQETWFGTDENKKVIPDFSELPAVNGTLVMAADTSLVPFVYVKEGKPAGIDVDTVFRFCSERGYGLELVPMDFSGIIPSVVSGKADFACSGIVYTEERAESVLFSEPSYEGGSVIAVLKVSEAADDGFFSSIKDSFYKTFIREDRWKLFVSGVETTLLITILAILLGTLLGFCLFMLCRNGNPAANKITKFCVRLVQGMPAVVLLMIFYYIIFGWSNISGTAVSVIAFTLVFGAGVFGMIRSGVGAVDKGQLEAAYSLGYTNRRAFYRVILPQALPHFMPAYKGSVTEIIKATAIVGYVAVQDLTKMGDIVRSRTYEAFFPLIAVAAIYFLLAGVLTFIVNKIELRIDPRQRKEEDILKGVKS